MITCDIVGKLERSLPESVVFVITTMGNVQSMKPVHISGWVVTWFLLGYIVRKNGGLLSTPMF